MGQGKLDAPNDRTEKGICGKYSFFSANPVPYKEYVPIKAKSS